MDVYSRKVRDCIAGATLAVQMLTVAAPVAFIVLFEHRLPGLFGWLVILIAAQIPSYLYFLQRLLLDRVDRRMFAAGAAT